MQNTMASPLDLTPTPQQTNLALLLIRIGSGLAFLYHGSAILFGAFGGPGLNGFSAFTHLPVAVAFLVGLAQLCGGLAILSGILARLGAACVGIVMIGAILLVHLSKGFDVTKGGMEYALTQLLLAAGILVAGAGAYSLAAWLPASWRRLGRPGSAGTSATYPTGGAVTPG